MRRDIAEKIGERPPMSDQMAGQMAGLGGADASATQLLNALPHPLLSVAGDGSIRDANPAAELFFAMSRKALRRINFQELLPFGSPLVSAIDQVRQRRAPINEYRVDLGTPKIGIERFVDIHIAPLPNVRDGVVIMLQERTIADKMDRQLTHRGAAPRMPDSGFLISCASMAPMAESDRAAQLLETAVGDEDRALCRLICDETDRIVNLVERMEAFSDGRPVERSAVNIHEILEHVRRIAQAGFARRIRFVENYDPSLPHVLANRDQLVQVFLNLVKNAAEAIGDDAVDGEIELTTAFRPGVRIRTPGRHSHVSLPLEFCVRDNGPACRKI